MLETYSLMPLSSDLVKGRNIVFVLASPGSYPSLDPAVYSISGKNSSCKLSPVNDHKRYTASTALVGFVDIYHTRSPRTTAMILRKVMMNIIEAVTLSDEKFVYNQRHFVVPNFKFVEESFSGI